MAGAKGGANARLKAVEDAGSLVSDAAWERVMATDRLGGLTREVESS